ncbi:Zn-dependent hydrolase, glyoxylase [Terriglobus roseus DSM 18391]|uniref:Zn-dependent hydrolase, glyoxylase n=1 Tax=Terriglobus roseus (strain DSM 18391 / NRRL B-41598 / KBS 63) TaxID=926566 RepID=I3ZGY9_TERRK|nr:MBL fold hydrolase [Terriglobus roseus]AFL88507.1 Zn-dependent hydrolase, glyoxylase [Terriglobus roseus DSM 18391]AFL88847.1 Zn-dependent hydrolase, glyoxylase [Terriglobus roseus DSM 18391]
MKIKRFEVAGLAQYSYMISSEGKAAVIDAMRDTEVYVTYAALHDLKIVQVLETHIHADFAAGSLALANTTGAELSLSSYDHGERYQYAMPHRALVDGESVHIGKVRLQALHTPGHTPEHLSFLAYDEEKNANEPVALFSGDFLFVGSLGRPDLLGEEAKVALANELYVSLQQRIASLPDGVQLFPGHGAGSLCGSGMSDRPESTLGYERKTNHLFQLSRPEFVETILSTVPPMPTYYPRMKQLNADGARDVSHLPGDHALNADTVHALSLLDDVTILDIRSPEAFGSAHLPGAINIGSGQNLSMWAGWLIDPHHRIVLVNDAGDDEASRRALVRVGLDNIEGYLAKGFAAWAAAGMDLSHTPMLSVQEVASTSSLQVLDVRSDAEWASGHIPGAQHVILGDLPQHISTLPDGPIVTVCGSGYRASVAASILQRSSHDGSVSVLEGGMAAWNSQLLAVQQT